jgi:tRNA A37 threonylcarbamoyladenosine synthetase subunit TsaC/SUA5/YrdC
VLDCTREPPRIIRAGAISPETLRNVTPVMEEGGG